PHFHGSFFKEFVVSYDRANASKVFKRLAKKGVLGGYPMDRSFGLRSQAASFCVTEVHTREDIEKLADAIEGSI
ncbi:MAG: aminomethyl-transferring glycine dehydrogenase, partial [Thaumarchaeota archaeon]|nr:aminomethyl-transferring glycine dehydrogenase [Nitrososphaerota archaeon]